VGPIHHVRSLARPRLAGWALDHGLRRPGPGWGSGRKENFVVYMYFQNNNMVHTKILHLILHVAYLLYLLYNAKKR